MKRTVLIAAAAAILIVIGLLLSGQSKPGDYVHEEFFNYTTYFCPKDDCIRAITGQLSSATSVQCAFYTADPGVIWNITTSYSEIVFDEKAKALLSNFSNIAVYKTKSKGIMHSKYCIINNETVITGSYNPTAAAKSDSNNVIMINSSALARLYGQNFNFLKNRSLEKKPGNTVVLNQTTVEVFFCPYDSCAAAVISELEKANQSILFAAYSFTSQEIANELIIKNSEGIAVSGVMDKSTSSSEYSKYQPLVANGINVTLKKSKGLMHNKFFVIDNLTVITGSFNPTENADKRNDENILVIRNREVARKYVDAAAALTNFK